MKNGNMREFALYHLPFLIIACVFLALGIMTMSTDKYVDEQLLPKELQSLTDLGYRYPCIIVDDQRLDFDYTVGWYRHQNGPRAELVQLTVGAFDDVVTDYVLAETAEVRDDAVYVWKDGDWRKTDRKPPPPFPENPSATDR